VLCAFSRGQLEWDVVHRPLPGRVSDDSVCVVRTMQAAEERAFGIEGHVWPVITLAKAGIPEQVYGRVAPHKLDQAVT
jgi:hypothetical protein